MNVFNEILSFLFITSLIYVFYVFINFIYKLFTFFRLNDESVRFQMNDIQLIILWLTLSITIFRLTY